jgi:two-component system cell cycle sensor histidine kinase PleC
MDMALLKQKVGARDRLLEQAETIGRQMSEEVLAALARGEITAAEAAARSHEAQLREITEHLRIYQAELHAQADELADSQARTHELLERFGKLFASMPVAALLVAQNGEVLETNAQAEQLLQLRPRSPSARFFHRLVDADHFQASVRPAFLQAQAEGASRVDQLAFLGEQGQRFVGELHIARLPVRQPGECQFACAVIDRSEHLRDLRALEAAAEALRQSEGFLADAARVARTGGWELTLRPRQLRWSAQLLQVLDLPSQQEASLEALLGLCERHDRAVLASAVASAERGASFEVELDMRSAEGRPLRVLAVGHAERADGVVVRVHGVLQDISTQHLVRRQMGDLSERLAIANDAGGIGVWDCDLLQGSVVFDRRLCELLGLQTSPLGDLAEALRPHLLADSALLLDTALRAAIDHLEPLNLELHLAPHHGDRWLQLTGRAHPDALGHAVRLVGCAWDNSPQHEALRLVAAKDAAESASRAKSAFLSRMSHELRTPLNAILGFSQLMRMEAEAGDLVLKPHRVTLIESAARHLLDLVNEVLDVSRIESGRLDVTLAPFDVTAVIHESALLVQGLAEQTSVTLELPPLSLRAPVLGDRLRLKEVLINLLTNAVKYNRPGGRVQVDVSPRDGQVVLDVADTGRGLDEEQLAGLFQPFNRVGAEASGIEGTGMGLFVSQRFMELMGGRIDVRSRPGAGTTFSVQLQTPPQH